MSPYIILAKYKIVPCIILNWIPKAMIQFIDFLVSEIKTGFTWKPCQVDEIINLCTYFLSMIALSWYFLKRTLIPMLERKYVLTFISHVGLIWCCFLRNMKPNASKAKCVHFFISLIAHHIGHASHWVWSCLVTSLHLGLFDTWTNLMCGLIWCVTQHDVWRNMMPGPNLMCSPIWCMVTFWHWGLFDARPIYDVWWFFCT